jgi:DNA-binding CsgD family transcriptional regulator
VRVTNVGDIGNTYDCPTIGCTGETTHPDRLCIGCESRSTVHRLPLVADVISRRHLDPMPRARKPHDLPGTGQPLSPAELEALQHLSHGLANAELAQLRGCTPATVTIRLKRLYLKLGARSRAHAVALGFRKGLLE